MLITYETRGNFGVVKKRATSAQEVQRLGREFHLLRHFKTDGVTKLHQPEVEPEFMSQMLRGAEPTEGELVLRFAGQRTLETFASPRDWEWLFVLWSCAQLLHRLHEQSVFHGAIVPSHIVLDSRKQPTLCSLGRAITFDDSGVLAQGDVSSFLKSARQVLGGVPSHDPGWAKDMRGGRPRVLHELKSLITSLAETRHATAAGVASQLGQLAQNLGYGAGHGDEVWRREMQPAERLLPA